MTEERGNWTGKLDFLLSCLGFAVGLGNVWRFPYLCYTNGGGVFLIPYTIMLFIVGIPLFLIELGIGQYSAKSPIVLFKTLSPIWQGLGYCMFLASIMVGIYYNMIIAWTIYYLFASFTSDLPWQHCGNFYNTDACFSHAAYTSCKEANSTNIYNLGICMNQTYANGLGIVGDTPLAERKSAPEEYYSRRVLGEVEDTNIGNIGGFQWGLVLSLLGAWVIVFLCLIKGIKSSGKVVYFTATFPYVVLTILLVRGALLEGAYEGIKFYMEPDWSKLSDIRVWQSAAVQIFYSLSIAGGGLITLASYNKFNNNLIRDTLIVCFGNCLTSVYAGFAIFSILGHMAFIQNVPVSEVVASSSGLAFIAYPEVVTRLPGSTVWAILFFFMLLTLGLDSQFAIVENIVTSLTDSFPSLRKRKTLVILATSVLGFLLGLPLCTQGGRYILELMDNYAAGWPYLIVGALECIIVMRFWGFSKFMDSLRQMTGWTLRSTGTWWSHLDVLSGTVAPLLVFVILIVSLIEHQPLTLGGYTYPEWANNVGYAMAFVPVAVIFVMGLVTAMLNIQDWRWLIGPTEEWQDNAADYFAENGFTNVSNPPSSSQLGISPNPYKNRGVYNEHPIGTYTNKGFERDTTNGIAQSPYRY